MFMQNILFHVFFLSPRAGIEGNDMWVWRDVDNNEEYVVIGTSGGTSFVRVTDPRAPEVLAILPTQ